jgi:alginate O-acetyltransferase complex protein AlgJ
MANLPVGYLPDRPRPAWFGAALATLFVATILTGFTGVFRTPRVADNPFENRALEPLPPFPDSRIALREFPARFERFFDDRFGLRAPLVHLDHWTRALVFGVSPVSKVLIGKSGWLYFRGEDSKAFDRWYRGNETVPDATLVALRDELLRRRDFLASHGIPFLVVVVPEKYSVYPEFLPDWATRIADRTPLDRLAADLVRYPRLQFIDLRRPLLKAKSDDRLYFQTDSHWNYLGATVGYNVLMAQVAQALPGLVVAPVARPPYVADVDYYSGDLAQMLGLQRQFRETDVAPLGKILATPEARCAKLDTAADAPNVENYVYRCPNAPRFTALMYRDSMAIPLIPMLAENFSRTTFVTSAQLDPAMVERLQPDIVIEELVERTLPGRVAFPMPR